MISNQNPNQSIKFSSPFRYRGNVIFPIILMIIFFPVGCLLLFKGAYFIQGTNSYYLKYHGNWGWLFFWAILFFPMTIILMIFVGFDVIKTPYHDF
ncbi:MAG: hypothetical protein ACRYGR_06470 [Janthinobacterium lividum]